MEDDKFIFLKDSFNMKDLLRESGAVFEIDKDYEDIYDKPSQPSSEDIMRSVHGSNGDCENEEDECLHGPAGLIQFDLLESKMVNITTDGSVKKLLIKQGQGPIVPEKALVDVHYQAYFELADEPFDSTYLRGKPERLALQAGVCLPGLEVALGTMKKNEVSRFLVKPEMAYGLLGIPPRILPNAEVLFEVELLNFVDGVEAEALTAIEKEANKCFDTVYKAAELKYFEGTEFYQKRNYGAAVSKYRKVYDLLESCHLANEQEEEKQQKFLLKIYTNLAICFNKMGDPRKACTMSQLALRINPNYCKALFAYGRALLMLHDYNQAILWLNKARKVSPNNTEISDELRKAYTKKHDAAAVEKLSCARMFSQPIEKKNDEQENQDIADFKEEALLILQEFRDSDATTQAMPTGMTQREANFIKTEALKMGLIFLENKDKSISIKKPK